MRRPMKWLLAALLCASAARAYDEPKKDPPKDEKAATPQDEFKALQTEQQKANQELIQKFQAAKSPDEQNKIRADFFKLQADFGARYVAFAKKNVKEAVAADALAQAVGVPPSTEADKVRNEAIDLLAEHFVQSPQMKMIVQRLGGLNSKAPEKLLKAVIEKNTDHDTQGFACLSLAMNLKNRAGEGEGGNADKLFAEAEKYFKMVSEKYADVKAGRGTLGATAQSQLTAMKNQANLAVGKVAPDIVGPDIDGKEFKLSDYRGKVILLDFWAHW